MTFITLLIMLWLIVIAIALSIVQHTNTWLEDNRE